MAFSKNLFTSAVLVASYIAANFLEYSTASETAGDWTPFRDTPTPSKPLKNEKAIRAFIGADSKAFPSLDSLNVEDWLKLGTKWAKQVPESGRTFEEGIESDQSTIWAFKQKLKQQEKEKYWAGGDEEDFEAEGSELSGSLPDDFEENHLADLEEQEIPAPIDEDEDEFFDAQDEWADKSENAPQVSYEKEPDLELPEGDENVSIQDDKEIDVTIGEDEEDSIEVESYDEDPVPESQVPTTRKEEAPVVSQSPPRKTSQDQIKELREKIETAKKTAGQKIKEFFNPNVHKKYAKKEPVRASSFMKSLEKIYDRIEDKMRQFNAEYSKYLARVDAVQDKFHQEDRENKEKLVKLEAKSSSGYGSFIDQGKIGYYRAKITKSTADFSKTIAGLREKMGDNERAIADLAILKELVYFAHNAWQTIHRRATKNIEAFEAKIRADTKNYVDNYKKMKKETKSFIAQIEKILKTFKIDTSVPKIDPALSTLKTTRENIVNVAQNL